MHPLSDRVSRASRTPRCACSLSLHHGRSRRISVAALLLAGLTALIPVLPARTQAQTVALKRYETRYYTIFTDLDADAVREATLRITHMAEEYQRRTRGFAGEIRERLPFYLFNKAQDYVAAGAPAGTAGVFMGDRLMAIAGEDAGGYTWHTVQHEGFHQFVHAVIKGDIPIWANEGLAEYFGESVWTGDGFVSGVVPPERLAQLRRRIREGSLKSIEEMMLLSHAMWNAEGAVANYDLAWSMVHFLAHAEDGKYQKPFAGFLRGVSGGDKWPEAWKRNFGSDVKSFQQRWLQYWQGLEPNPTRDLYARASAETIAAFLGRAQTQRQFFKDWDELVATAKDGRVSVGKNDWLPSALLDEAIARTRRVGDWSLERRGGMTRVLCRLDDGTQLVGSYKLKAGRFDSAEVKVTPARSKPGSAGEKRGG